MIKNLLVVHGGAPTAVINSSLYGIVEEARDSGKIDHAYGAIGGVQGILQEQFVDLLSFPESKTCLLLQTPGSSIGTSRYIVTDDDYEDIAKILKKNQIDFVFLNGGNGTMDTSGKLHRACIKHNIFVIGVPKTIDNDIDVTDHAPGYASAAGFIASAVSAIGRDVDSLPIHVSIIETMGRNVGWISAASVLARKHPGDAPHLIYLPERPFSEEEFLEDVNKLHKTKSGIVVVCSEGLKNVNGDFVVPPIFGVGRSVYPSYVGIHLANLVIKELGIKSRYEKPGLLERTRIFSEPNKDQAEAIAIGRAAVRVALDGKSGIMIGIERVSSNPYQIRLIEIPLEKVMLVEKHIPSEWINQRGNDVTDDFTNWCKPLVGNLVGNYFDLNLEKKRVR